MKVLMPLSVLSLVACDQGGGSLRGEWLAAEDCKAFGETFRYEPFEMDLSFASITEQLGTMLLRLSPSARQVELSDQIAVTIDGTPDVRSNTRGEGAATLDLHKDGHGDADLTLMLTGRCAHNTQSLAAEGTITFYDYGWKNGARVRGEMAFDLYDRRTGELVGEGFVGDFDFEAKTGSPHTAFSPNDY